MKTQTIIFFLGSQIVVFSSLTVALLQTAKIIDIPNSQVNIAWTSYALAVIIPTEIMLLFYKYVPLKHRTILSALFSLGLLQNMLKFSMGLAQNVSLYNKFEHTYAGFVLSFGIFLLRLIDFLPLEYKTRWIYLAVIFLIANTLQVLHEVLELFIDKFLNGVNIGRGWDTNIDLCMTMTGTVIAFLAQYILSAYFPLPNKEHVIKDKTK